ncbi:MAG: MFS transporter [Candidatus Eisenbacteria bacterium]|nr:MFS transporter [Candidatus Eisenbacteria bacterium]
MSIGIRNGGRRLPKPQTFVAFGYRNYRLWFVGQLVSLLGTWMQMTAQGYLVYQLTHSKAYLGYVAFAAGLPIWVFMLYGGVVADRMSRRKLMVMTQTGMMLLAFALAALTFANLVRPAHILGLAFLLGIANAFDAPARQSFVLELVERHHLANAIALNSTMFNAGTAVGPAVAGFAYAAFGPGWCFLLNGASFIAVIAALMAMKIETPVSSAPRRPVYTEMLEGLRYVRGHAIIRSVIALVGCASLFAMGLFTLLPAWAVDILHGDARTLGFMQSARGVGALAGALTLASISAYPRKGRLLTTGAFAFPVMLIAFSFTRHAPPSLATLLGMGMAQILTLNMANVIVQTKVSDSLRGRVMGVYTQIFFGVMPIGGLLAGGVGDRLGAPSAFLVGGLGLLACVVLLWTVQRDLASVTDEAARLA